MSAVSETKLVLIATEARLLNAVLAPDVHHAEKNPSPLFSELIRYYLIII